MMRLQRSGHALGSDCVLTVITDETKAKTIFQELWTTIHAFEARFSRFQPDSELTQLNQSAGNATKISADFYNLLQASIALSNQTQGLYNPMVLPALQQAGYKGSWPTPTVFDTKLDYSARRIASAADIKLTKTTATLPSDTALDFGGIGKGYLLDILADILDTKHVKHYWLSLGGDVVLCGFNLEDQPWRIGIASAFQADETVDFVDNPSGERMAIATSGTAKRKGADWHHIIDPRTGKSAANDVISATVVHDRATEADVFAKCLVIIGVDAAPDFAKQHNIKQYVMQQVDETTISTLH